MIIAGIIIFISMLCVAIVWSSMIVAKQSDERKEEYKKTMGSYSAEIYNSPFDLEEVNDNGRWEN